MSRLIKVVIAACVVITFASCNTGDRREYRSVALQFAGALAARDTATLRGVVVPERAAILLQGLPGADDRRVLAVGTAPTVQYRGAKDGRSNYFLHPTGASDLGLWIMVRQAPTPRVYSYQLVPDLGP